MNATMPSRSSRLLRSTLAATLTAGALMFAAAPAHAEVIDTDRVLINGGKADFGNGRHEGGSPKHAGTLSWNDRGTTRTGTLTGNVYWDDLFSGGCARVVLTLLDSSGNRLDRAYSEPVCGTGSNFEAEAKRISLAVSSPAAHRAVITSQAAPGETGPWSVGGTRTVRYGQH